MNKVRQNVIRAYIEKLDDVKTALEEDITAMRDEYDDKSEKWRDGEAGQEMEEELSQLDDAFNNLDSVIDTLSGLAPSKGL